MRGLERPRNSFNCSQ